MPFLLGYVKGEQSVLKDSKDSVEKAWKGYSICNEAIIDPNNAWIEAQSLVSRQLDPGLSKSQVLFWASTREGFLTGTTADLDDDDATSTVPDRPVAPSNNKKIRCDNLSVSIFPLHSTFVS